jgi:hypothetical protein
MNAWVFNVFAYWVPELTLGFVCRIFFIIFIYLFLFISFHHIKKNSHTSHTTD